MLTVTREEGYESSFSYEYSAARSEASPPQMSKQNGRPSKLYSSLFAMNPIWQVLADLFFSKMLDTSLESSMASCRISAESGVG